MSYYTLEFDFSGITHSVKSYISSSEVERSDVERSDVERSDVERSDVSTDGYTVCLNCVVYNCVKDKTIQICIGSHDFLAKLGLIDDSNALNDTVMEYIIKELDLLNIQFNPNTHYFTDRLDEECGNTIMHSIRIPYEGSMHYECDTITDAYRLCFDIAD